MKTKAVRLYGEKDLSLEEFDLRPIKDGEILIKVISDGVCMSTYKTAMQGAKHIRVPNDVKDNPVIIGHEFCAEIVEVSKRWENEYKVGDKVVMPPVLSYLGGMQTVGYSFKEIGGVSTYSIVYEHIIENGYLMKLDSTSYFSGSLIEPASCVLRGYKGSLHLDEKLLPFNNIKKGGKLAILAGCGPMGLVAIDIALNGDIKPSLVVVTDLNAERLARAEKLFNPADARQKGVKLVFANTSDKDELLSFTDGLGYDDVFVYAPVADVVELGNAILAFDGCLNFFAGPTDKGFSAKFNFYQAHYSQHHISGTSGSTPDDMRDIVRLIGEKRINPAVMVTHIGGLNSAIESTLNLPKIGGGKKLIYTHIDLPLTAIEDFEKLGESNPLFKSLYEIVSKNGGLWCAEAEKYLLEKAPKIY